MGTETLRRGSAAPRAKQRVRSDRRLWLLAGLCLALITLAVHGRSLANDFVDYDDQAYVVQNPHVHTGLIPANARWALTATEASNWHPATWLSLQLDASLYGQAPAGFHLTNVLLHEASTLLLWGILWSMTGAAGCSILVAALFALHPLHVESVAWIAERKDVLSGLFFMLTLYSYWQFTLRQGTGRYVAVIACLALGLAAKPMLVTVPFVLLLLDYWPLQRAGATSAFGKRGSTLHQSQSWARLLMEKVPLLALVGATVVLTLAAQERGGSFTPLESWGLGPRIGNAAVAYVRYLGKLVYPAALLPFYPLPTELPLWKPTGAAVVLIAISGLAWWERRHRPYVLVGWTWYLGMLVPVIGLVQVGAQALADRYTYLPLIGIFVALAWGLAEFVESMRMPAAATVGAAVAVSIVCAVGSWLQVGFWHDSVQLWSHALAAEPQNHLAHDHLGTLQARQGNLAGAINHFVEAVRIRPGYDRAHNNLGTALADQGKLADAEKELRRALELNPALTAAHVNLGMVLARQGRPLEAEKEFVAALGAEPGNAEANYNYAVLLADRGDVSDAEKHFRQAILCKPDFAAALNGLGGILIDQGKAEQAIELLQRAALLEPGAARYRFGLAHALHQTKQITEAERCYREALQLDPNYPALAARTAWYLATDPEPRRRNGRRALRLSQEACEATGWQDPGTIDALAAAYAELGRYPDAVAAERLALAKTSEPEQRQSRTGRLRLYERQQAFRRLEDEAVRK